MSDWQDYYGQLIGKELTSLALEPITCDTRGVVDDIGMASLTYSGCVALRFSSGRMARLTWDLKSLEIIPASLREWNDEALDKIHVSPDFDWGKILGQHLSWIEVFKFDGYVAGIRHAFDNGSFLWVATADARMSSPGSPAAIAPMDDLWVSVDQEPSNLEKGILIACITDPTPTA
ncbi:MAG: hypothetical protein JWM33_1528 [Caulobacteraceae bacterium]|nr:hypothetical protein [Caulobacteraceae bacterium]